MLMINDSQPPGLDVSSYTIEEIHSITSEYTLKNTVRTTNHNLPPITTSHQSQPSANYKLQPYTITTLN